MANIREIDLTTPAMQAARGLCDGCSPTSGYVRGVAELLIDIHSFGSMEELRGDLIHWLVTGKLPARTPANILADFDRGCRGEADIDMRDILWEIIEDVQSTYRKAMAGNNVVRADLIELEVNDYLANNYGDD